MLELLALAVFDAAVLVLAGRTAPGVFVYDRPDDSRDDKQEDGPRPITVHCASRVHRGVNRQ